MFEIATGHRGYFQQYFHFKMLNSNAFAIFNTRWYKDCIRLTAEVDTVPEFSVVYVVMNEVVPGRCFSSG